jgi:hypothetical protein
MYENLIPPLIILSILLSLVLVPALLYAGLRKIADPVPLRLPLFLAVVVLLVKGVILQFSLVGESNSVAGLLVYYPLLFILLALAVITPYFWMGNRTGIRRPWVIFALLSFMSLALWLFSTLGESREGGPYSPFFPALPLTGWILDGTAAILNLPIVYTSLPVHIVLFEAGLYLEIFFMATLIYALLGMLKEEKTNKTG